jgi:hypothetical protein
MKMRERVLCSRLIDKFVGSLHSGEIILSNQSIGFVYARKLYAIKYTAC